MEAEVHLGQDYQGNLSTAKNTHFDKIKPLLGITRNLIIDQEHEIHGMYTTDVETITWVKRTLLNDKAIKLSWQKCTSSQIRCFVPEAELVGLRNLLSIVSWSISMENQSCSNEKISQVTPR